MISFIQSLYDLLGVSIQVNNGDVAGIVCVFALLVFSISKLIGGVEQSRIDEIPASEKENVETVGKAEVAEETVGKVIAPAPIAEGPSWSERLKKGLSRSRSAVWGKLADLMSGESLDEDTLEEIEELLYSADIGSSVVSELMEALSENAAKLKDGADLKGFLFDFLKNKMGDIQSSVDLSLYDMQERKAKETTVIMVVGVNGAGKTTTIGKLATKLTRQGAKVVVGACDTFRAAAVDQLQVWVERAGAEMIRAKENADPSGVAYDAVAKAKSMGADYCIIDTAGRLHTKANLMEELSKTKRVISKVDETAPHQVLLVIDSITGQNALRQAEEFNKALAVTGLVFTKCDGSSKAGNAISITQSLNVPITYIGVGEDVEDLNIFDLEEYLNALLDI